jgi:hypothetical protein
MQFDAIIAQYRADLERLNYVRGSINVYLRSIRRLFRLMEEQGVALGDLTSDVAEGPPSPAGLVALDSYSAAIIGSPVSSF